MVSMSTPEIMQLIAWAIALSEVILGLYILVLNLWNKANWHVGILLLLFGVNSYALGLFAQANFHHEAKIPATLLAATTPAAQIGLLLVAIVLLKPEWLQGRGKWLWRSAYIVFLLPIALTIIDSQFKTSLWFTGLDPDFFSPGYLAITEYTQGILAPFLRPLLLYMVAVITLVPLTWITFFDKSISSFTKRLGYILLATQIAAILLNFILFSTVSAYFAALITSTFFVIGYAYAAFRQLISARSLQKGRLQYRITAIILVISTLLLIGLSSISISKAKNFLTDEAFQRLDYITQTISSTVETWLEFNEKALDSMVKLPEIMTMNPTTQKPILENMSAVYSHMYLVSTIDLEGMNVARSDDESLKYYGDRLYFQKIIEGAADSQQTVIGKTTGLPALVFAKPIQNREGLLKGIGFYASTLETISEAIQIENIGVPGQAFIVDENNQVIAHPDPKYTSDKLINFSSNPVVASMRQDGTKNLVRYTDSTGATWFAKYHQLENGWGVIVQQDESDLLAISSEFQTVVFFFLIVGIVLLSILTSLAIWQAVQPLKSLTSTAIAIAEGDLSKVAPIESEDEIGLLAKAFNHMTEQLLGHIGNLERRVSDRTKDLERRSNQLLAAADVGKAASTILNSDALIQEVVEVIRDRFELYYVGLFLVDDNQEWANLRAGTGSAGKAMLNRQHKIQVGQGMIGWSIANAQSRISLEAGQDAVRLATDELPETRSEAAIPLRARGQVIGAITVQDSRPDRFDELIISSLQTMSDLVSIAIDNADLFSESQIALEATRKAYGEVSSQSWEEYLKKSFRYRSSNQGGQEIDDGSVNESIQPKNSLTVPIHVRNTIIGELITHKTDGSNPWQPDELNLIDTIVEQLGVALEGARLYEETQRRATFERLTREVTTKIRENLDIDTILDVAGPQSLGKP